MKFPYYPSKPTFLFSPHPYYRPPLPPHTNIKQPISFNTCNSLSHSTNNMFSNNSNSSNKPLSSETSTSKESDSTNSLRKLDYQSPCENDSEKIFSILGFDLYLDDLIILALLFFLYKEEVDDIYLYLSLILLLLS